MRKIVMLLCSILMVLGVVGTAMAIPTTWTDTIDFTPDRLISAWSSYSYTHDITDDTADGQEGFDGLFMGDGGDDIIYSYTLAVTLYDDGGLFDFCEVAYIDQPGVLGALYGAEGTGVVGSSVEFAYTNEYGWSIAGLIQLNLLGTLDVTVSSIKGDFYLAASTLVASGDNSVSAAPVPEPATMILLGTGLLGMVGMGRKRYGKRR